MQIARFIFSCFLFVGVTFSQEIVTIQGFAPTYVGKKIAIYEIDDYLTYTRTKSAETTVKADSTFEVSLFIDEIKKVDVRAGKNYFQLYVQPKATYDLVVQEKSSYKPYHPDGTEVDFFFLGLDSTDVNFSILTFEDELLNFLQKNYNQKTRNSGDFAKELEGFKTYISDNYIADTSDYFRTYVTFAIASLDNLAFKGNRNKYEKYDFYIKPQTVWYHNDRYMEYILQYYDQYASQLPRSLNQQFYDGVVRSSPTLIMNVLGKDYALQNIRLREFIMLKMLKDVYFTGEYPETNIISILDSVSAHGLFEANKPIAAQLKNRLTDLVPGGKAPNFVLDVGQEKKSLNDFKGKHLYMHFIKLNAEKSMRDLPLLKKLYNKYNKGVEFLTVFVYEGENQEEDITDLIKEHNISWKATLVSEEDMFVQQYKAVFYPFYILLDTQGYVVAAPALSPRPNNEYETIERSLFQINKRLEDNQRDD